MTPTVGHGSSHEPYYRPDLSWVHHQGFGFHADRCAPAILEHLEPVLERGGLVLELGCGSGLLTRHLVEAGHRVVATDASPAMLDLARRTVPDAAEVRELVMPDDPLQPADAIVSVGHPVNYLRTAEAIWRAFEAVGAALLPGGRLAMDVCDLSWGDLRRDQPSLARAGDDWAIISEFSVPRPDRFVREMTTFVRNEDGTWRRDTERHDNVLVDTSRVPELLGRYGIEVELVTELGEYELAEGLVGVLGAKRA